MIKLKKDKLPVLAMISLLVTVLFQTKQLLRLLNQSDIFEKFMSIDWVTIILVSLQLAFPYFFIVLSALPIIEYFSPEKYKYLMENSRAYKAIIPVSIVTSIMLNMTVDQLAFFTLITALVIIFQIYYRIVK